MQNTCISNGARWKKIFFFEVGVFKQGNVLKQMFQKGYKISFRMYLNLCNTKFSRIYVEKRVYKEVILSLHFSIASFDMVKSNHMIKPHYTYVHITPSVSISYADSHAKPHLGIGKCGEICKLNC